MEIVKKIKFLAQERGIKLNFICAQLGLTSRTYFHDIEKNGRTIPADKLSIIADILNTTPEYLLGLTDKKEKPKSNIKFNLGFMAEGVRFELTCPKGKRCSRLLAISEITVKSSKISDDRKR